MKNHQIKEASQSQTARAAALSLIHPPSASRGSLSTPPVAWDDYRRLSKREKEAVLLHLLIAGAIADDQLDAIIDVLVSHGQMATPG